ncbi:MAG: hypothetical protein IPP99_08840 [Chitinophagaceae bacterium]|nr:hypothetical protein [Chitinophagaceae bacterium]
MKAFLLTVWLFCMLLASAQDPLPPIGEWRDQLPYHRAIAVQAGTDKIYTATPYSLFSLQTTDQSIDRFSRVNGLNETGISSIAYDPATEKLLIAYNNSNIDILHRLDVFNIPDLKRDNIIGDKTIYHIYPLNGLFYLSTGLGIVVADGSRYEIKDSWFIGNNGNQVKVTGFTSDGSFYYAATAEGLKRAAINGPNPANYINWQLISGINGLPAGSVQQVVTVQNKIILLKNDSLYLQSGNNWSFLYRDGWNINSMNIAENRILLCERQGNTGRVQVLQPDGTVFRSTPAAIGSLPMQALLFGNETWLADSSFGLTRFNAAGNAQKYIPNSPYGIATGASTIDEQVFYATAGKVDAGWNPQNNRDGIYQFKEGQWTNYNRQQYPLMDSLPDLICIATDKRDGSIWAGSMSGGLLHIKNGPAFDIFKQNAIGSDLTNSNAFRVAGLCFDPENNLWLSNFGAAQPLRVRKNDGSWKAFNPPFLLNGNALSQILIDQQDQKWIVSPLGNGLLCYNHGASIDNTGDDRWKKLGMGSGNGNLPSNEVLCVAKDKNGFIWIGTADGVAVIQCPELIFEAGACDAIWPVIPNGNFAGYLLKGQSVRSIAVDGADRKWIATANAVFLVDATGEKLIYRFTEDNSPLLSNDVSHISIDGKSGEVYFSTAKGICSFRSTATEGGEKNESVLVFPNPVPPGYSGTIAIKGLANNSIVKITELDGRLVYQTRALGGQAIWNGRNYRGQRVASGAYLVLVSQDAGTNLDGQRERTAAKIFFISQ